MNDHIFVGREKQIEDLNQRLELALRGKTQFAFVSGQAGAGKTRLLEQFVKVAQATHPNLIMTHGDCNAQSGISDPYLPFREILNLLVGIEDANLSGGSLTEENGQRIQNLLTESGRILLEIGPDLIGSFVPGGALLSVLGRAVAVKTRAAERLEEIQKKQEGNAVHLSPGLTDQGQVFEQYTKCLEAIAAEHPLVIIVDDLHWTDQASASLLFHLARRIQDSPVMIIGTYRPVEVATGSGPGTQHPLANVLTELKRLLGENTIDLDQLDEAEKTRFFNQFIDAEPNKLGEEFRERFFGITEGHPLFTVELLRSMQERGDITQNEEGQWVAAKDLDWASLPGRIEGVIEGRIQRLDPEDREILAAASLQGNTFLAEIVARVLGLNEKQVIRSLSGDLSKVHQIVRPQSVQKFGERHIATYSFQHSLFQQFLERSVDNIQRRAWHEDTGLELEALYGDGAEEIAAQLAYHFSEASMADKTIQYATLAGDRARGLYANRAAIDFYEKVLAHVVEQKRFRLASQVLMKQALAYQSDFAFTEANEAYSRAFSFRRKADEQLPSDYAPATRPLRIRRIDPTTLDPGAVGDINSSSIIHLFFSGLVSHDVTLNVAPDLAERWEILDEGKRYRFHLRDNLHWTDGEPITADDFVFAFQRLFSPELSALNVSTIFHVIKGAAELLGSKDKVQLGVTALDERTLEFELEKPTAYFLHLLCHANSFPVPQRIVEKHGAKWTDIDKIVSNGPFALTEYVHGERMLIIKSGSYHKKFRGNLQEIEISLTFERPPNEFERMYIDDKVDIVDGDSSEKNILDRDHADEYQTFPYLAVHFLVFNTSTPPLDDARVRRALSLAVDRDALLITNQRDYLPASGGLTPLGIPGHVPNISRGYDVAQARQLLSEAGYPQGSGFPEVQLLTVSGRGEAEFLCAQWKETLNIEVRANFISMKEALDRPDFSIWLSGWVADYPDPDSFLYTPTWLPSSNWNNPEYLDLVRRARTSLDQTERMVLYRKAELIIHDQVPVLPISYGQVRFFIKPWVKNFYFSPVGETPLENIVLEEKEN